MPVRGGFIGEFCAAIIAFVFPRRPASAAAASASASALFIAPTIVIFLFHHQCHPFHVTEILISI
jgi:hypothetical protein